ncbi:GTP cyclohydrolase 1 type 2 [Desulfomarina profundi]|uniref:GTP cyclohydrolase 1 type 2 homolog n=1 Tax=Desulfomarina profundi TaxID=2772557 RepID=A0A8D5FKX2_9BACT|nr:Nif3-like dinuclear metal center hexameric protein [Desulfomarina profundi]BCL62800.1 GTP cyclohydrolase 1 type 2 [Desulfomarina profundi]
MRVKDIVNSLNHDAPFELAEQWDNVGLLVGDPEREVSSVLVALDPTNILLDEALTVGADTVVTHHPVIFKPLTHINTADPAGRLLEKALAGKISIICCHTNLDSARDGVSDILARRIGLSGLTPLLPTGGDGAVGTGLGRIGQYKNPLSARQFIQTVLNTLNLQSIQMAGNLPGVIRTVALCGGSGSDLANRAWSLGADVYLSAEIKHSTAIWARENNFCIIDGTHFATEQPAVALLVEKLESSCRRQNRNISILQSETEHHPFVLIDKNYDNTNTGESS